MRDAGRAYCPRCDDEVGVDRPWRGFRVLFWGWCGVTATLALLLPFYFVDICISVPSAMLIALAGGPIFRFAHEKPSCLVCSAFVDESRRERTGLRLRAHRPSDDA